MDPTALSWPWIALMLIAPLPLAAAAAYPFWTRNEPIFGNLVGATIIFAAAFGMIVREFAEIDQTTRQCLDAGFTCWPTPSPFVRYAIYASIGLAEVIALFMLSLRIERKRRDRLYAPEWR